MISIYDFLKSYIKHKIIKFSKLLIIRRAFLDFSNGIYIKNGNYTIFTIPLLYSKLKNYLKEYHI